MPDMGKAGKFLRVLNTFLLINFSWIFFRANTLSNAFYVVKNMFVGLAQTSYLLTDKREYIILILLFFALEYFQRKQEYLPSLKPQKTMAGYFANVLVYSLFIWSIFVFGEFGNKEFIYFQF